MQKLQLYQFDGAPMNPMYLAYQPPLMLPTQTLNPTVTATGGAQPQNTGSSKQKRSEPLAQPQAPLSLHHAIDSKLVEKLKDTKLMDPNFVWWVGMGMTVLGGAAYWLF